MIAFMSLALLVVSPNPFTPDATATVEQAGGWTVTIPLNTADPGLRHPPHAGTYTDLTSWQQPGADAALVTSCACTPQEAEEPIPDSVSDWSSIYQIEYGIQIEGIAEYSWPDSSLGPMYEVINHVRASAQALRAVALRDVGVDLKVNHIQALAWPLPADGTGNLATAQIWSAVPARPYQAIIRLNRYIRGGVAPAKAFGACGEEGAVLPFPIAQAGYNLEDQMDQTHDAFLQIVAHELYHMLFGIDHTECYHDANGDPLEHCYEIGCYEGPTICPDETEISVMGYCWPCYAQAPALRIGTYHSPMTRLARSHVLYDQPCLGPSVGTMPSYSLTANYDGDAYPNDIDNCRDVRNESQTDSDFDGKGDACETGCQVAPARAGSAWLLLVPALLLAMRRARPTRG